MAIYTGVWSKFEKPQSARFRNLTDAVNSHVHDGINGEKISWTDITGAEDAFDGSIFADGSIAYDKFAENTIKIGQIDTTSIHIDASGYAVYA